MVLKFLLIGFLVFFSLTDDSNASLGDMIAEEIAREKQEYEAQLKRDCKIINIIEKKALEGHVNSLEKLVDIYENGRCGVFENDKKALNYRIRLAKIGNAKHQHKLAHHYSFIGNDKKAFKWFNKAAKQGFIDSQVRLTYMYSYGEGVKKNEIMAYVWAAMVIKQQGYGMYMDVYKSKLSAKQLYKAQELAIKCYESNYKKCGLWFDW